MNIKVKILVPSLVAVAMMAVVGVASYLGLKNMRASLDQMATQGLQHIELLNQTRSSLLQANNGAYRLFSTMANFDEARIKKETANVLAHADKAIQILKTMQGRSDLEEAERKALAALDEPLAKYRKNVAQAIDMAESDLASGTGMMQAADKRFLEVEGKLNSFLDEQQKEAVAMVAATQSASSKTIGVIVAMLVAAVVASTAIALWLSARIVGPLLDAITTAKSVANGNLANHIDTTGRDETGELMRALAVMQESLRTLIVQIGSNAQATDATCRSMSEALAKINESVSGQTDATSAVAAAVQEMSVSVTNISENANHSLEANQSSAQLAVQGADTIKCAFDEMTSISRAVSEAANVIENVGQQSSEISSVVSVIREVADQTNLLALNAAIEAARAGEAGRGFAVVADEVRKLAEKTTRSSKEITEMIAKMQQSSEAAVKNIHAVVSQVEKSATYAQIARDSIERIRTGAGESEGYARDISLSLREQTQTGQMIAQQVEDISRMSEENANSVVNAQAAMRELEAESSSLQASVSRFKT